MAKEKKITVNFYAVEVKSEKDKYSIYCKVTYDRNITRFPINHYLGEKSLEAANNIIEHSVKITNDKWYLGWKKKLIEEIVRYEIDKYREGYSVIGLNERMSFYNERVSLYLSKVLYIVLLKLLEDKITYRQYIDFSERLGDKSGSGWYFLIFNHIEYLNENYSVNVTTDLGKFFYHLVASIGYFACFELNNSNEKSKKFIEENKIIVFFGEITIGEWLSNLNNIKIQFQDFIQSNNLNDLLNVRTNGRYFEIAKKYSLDVPSVNYLDFENLISQILKRD